MIANLVKFIICLNCGSRKYLEDYPIKGQKSCSKCGHESIEIKLKKIKIADEILDNCSFCGKEDEDDDTLLDKEEIIIFKCKSCGKIDGYKFFDNINYFLEYSFDTTYEYEDKDLKPFDFKRAKKEGTHILPASKYREFAQALKKKEKNPKTINKKQLSALIREKLPKIQQYHIDSKILNSAKSELHSLIEHRGPFTHKQLGSLLSAAIGLAQDDLIKVGSFNGKKITERQTKEIFDIDKKTTRKHKKFLKKNRVPLRLKVWARKKEGEPVDSMSEIPKELKSISKLEKPYKNKCFFCSQIKLLNWQIRYIDGSWSDLCDQSIEKLKYYSLQEEWEIEKYFK